MHTLTSENGTKFHFNSDLSGDVIINTPKGDEIEVNGNAILEFVAYYIQCELIAKIENKSWQELIGLE